ncbi:unnamed protein product, partial [Polarella glacialis]
ADPSSDASGGGDGITARALVQAAEEVLCRRSLRAALAREAQTLLGSVAGAGGCLPMRLGELVVVSSDLRAHGWSAEGLLRLLRPLHAEVLRPLL